LKTIEQVLGRRPIHPFPARMAPTIALDAIGRSRKPLRILDPMAGSGTVLAVAKAKGHHAVGVDCDPLSVLIASVWTRGIDRRAVQATACTVLVKAKTLFNATAERDSYPKSADEETRRFLRFWFDQCARRELFALSKTISRVHERGTREALWAAFSRMIIAKQAGVSLAMDLPHSRPHKVHSRAPVRPFEQFIRSVQEVVANCPESGHRSGPNTDVRLGDCRRLPFYRGSFDLVITSPPYLNAIDYMRCSKFSLVWMGHRVSSLRIVRSTSVGSECTRQIRDKHETVRDVVATMVKENSLTPRTRGLLEVYADDLVQCISEVSRVLRPKGNAVFVIGDNQIGEVFVSNSNAIKAIAARAHLALEAEYVRELPPNRRYLPPPSSRTSGDRLQSRMRSEVILRFAKVNSCRRLR
jgi:DNA modification methylase